MKKKRGSDPTMKSDMIYDEKDIKRKALLISLLIDLSFIIPGLILIITSSFFNSLFLSMVTLFAFLFNLIFTGTVLYTIIKWILKKKLEKIGSDIIVIKTIKNNIARSMKNNFIVFHCIYLLFIIIMTFLFFKYDFTYEPLETILFSSFGFFLAISPILYYLTISFFVTNKIIITDKIIIIDKIFNSIIIKRDIIKEIIKSNKGKHVVFVTNEKRIVIKYLEKETVDEIFTSMS